MTNFNELKQSLIELANQIDDLDKQMQPLLKVAHEDKRRREVMRNEQGFKT